MVNRCSLRFIPFTFGVFNLPPAVLYKLDIWLLRHHSQCLLERVAELFTFLIPLGL
jgi:hypothetical protein